MRALTIRIEPLRTPLIAFAHRGAAFSEAADSGAAYALAVRLGATGIETDLWITADGHPVLAATGSIRRGLRRHQIRDQSREELGDAVSDLDDLANVVGPHTHVLLTVRDSAAVSAAVERLGDREGGTGLLWLGSTDLVQLTSWRLDLPDVGLVYSTRLTALSGGPERHAAALSRAGVNAVQMPYADWTGGLTTLFHRFEVECFGWDAPHARMMNDLIRAGCDAISTVRIDRLSDALGGDRLA
jgi:glycerophosphoryl diester phosphodiesterase